MNSFFFNPGSREKKTNGENQPKTNSNLARTENIFTWKINRDFLCNRWRNFCSQQHFACPNRDISKTGNVGWSWGWNFGLAEIQMLHQRGINQTIFSKFIIFSWRLSLQSESALKIFYHFFLTLIFTSEFLF